MESLISLVAFFYLGWGLGQIAALIGIMLKWAIPRAPMFFRLIISVPLFFSALAAIGVFVIALTGQEKVAGLNAVDLLAISTGTQFVVWWAFVAYAVYYYLSRGGRCGA